MSVGSLSYILMELEFHRLEFHVKKKKSTSDFVQEEIEFEKLDFGLKLEFNKLEFQKQSNLLKCFIRMLFC